MGFGIFDVIAAPLGGIISSAIGSHSAKSVSADNIAAAREAMQNKHQWEVEDLKKAGLNPIISAHGSTGTTSGSGVSFTPENPFANYAANRIAMKKAESDINSANAYAQNLLADAKLKGFEYIKQRSSFYDWLQEQQNNSAISAVNLANAVKNGRLIDANVASVEANSAKARATEGFWDAVGKFSNSAISKLDFLGTPPMKGENYYYYGD